MEVAQHPDRNAQLEHINAKARSLQREVALRPRAHLLSTELHRVVKGVEHNSTRALGAACAQGFLE